MKTVYNPKIFPKFRNFFQIKKNILSCDTNATGLHFVTHILHDCQILHTHSTQTLMNCHVFKLLSCNVLFVQRSPMISAIDIWNQLMYIHILGSAVNRHKFQLYDLKFIKMISKKWWRGFSFTSNLYLLNFMLWMDFFSFSQPILMQSSLKSPQVHRNIMVLF